MRIPVTVQREIARRICELEFSNRAIGAALNVSHNTVRVVREKLQATGAIWVELAALDDSAFALRLGTARAAVTTGKVVPDWDHFETELKTRDVTVELLWQEYREYAPNGLSYPHLTRLFKRWKATQRMSMRQIYRAGDKLFVDFCGRTMPITDPDTGVVTRAQVFVAVLGASGAFFVWAVPSQQVPHWLECHIKTFEHFGGVPREVVPDNLKSAVIQHRRLQIILNAAYKEFSEHYGFAPMPARPLQPRDKALAEVTVQIVQRGVLARLRHRTFFSVAELNTAIAPLVTAINEKTTRKFPKSRRQRFLEIDVSALQPLPAQRYDVSGWKYQVRVGQDYHVEWAQHHYSVPSQYVHQRVDLRVTATTIEVLFQRQRIASHALSDRIGGCTTLVDHMPIHHQRQHDNDPEALLAWANQVGPNTSAYVQLNLSERRDFANGLKTVQQLRRWAREEQNHHRLESACGYAVRINALPFRRLESILRHNTDLRTDNAPTKTPIVHANLRGADYFKQGENL